MSYLTYLGKRKYLVKIFEIHAQKKSGTYIYEFISGELKHTGKIVIIK